MSFRHFMTLGSNLPGKLCSLRMYSVQKQSRTVLMMGAHQNEAKNYKPRWDRKEELMDAHRSVYSDFVTECLEELHGEEFSSVRKRIEELYHHISPYHREIYASLFILYPYAILENPEKLTAANFERVSKLTWCFEMVNTIALTIDDIMDDSDRRWKKTCWHKKSEIGLSSINDYVIFRQLAYSIIKKYFSNYSCYPFLVKAYYEVHDGIVAGQMYDLYQSAAFRESQNTNLFTMDRYMTMCFHKSYKPVTRGPLIAAMALTNNLDKFYKYEHVFIPVSVHAQIANDMLDAFGSYENFGKGDDDIVEGKHSWVITKAFEYANKDQKQLLLNSYGRPEPEARKNVYKIYKELDVIQKYYEHKNVLLNNTYKELEKMDNPGFSELIKTFLDSYVDADEELSYR